jgi:hypothetical protein
MRKVNEGVSRLLPRSEIEQPDFASTKTNSHPAVERRIVAPARKSIDAPRHLLRMNLLHDAGGFLVGDQRGALGLEYRIPHVMVAMEMTVDHLLDGLVGHLADALEEIAPLGRMRARVDHGYALSGDKENRVRPAEIEKEINVVCHLFDARFGRRARLCGGGQPRTEQTTPSRTNAKTTGVMKNARAPIGLRRNVLRYTDPM